MRYVFMQYFGPPYEVSSIPKEVQLDIAKRNAADSLAKELLERAVFEETPDGCLRCTVDF